MTVGMRIAQKRKERALSQEGLGELLGVSRQAIYKWESDASLPEIEKLVALSRIFSVSVGWLLGEEGEPDPGESGELTDAQIRVVEEIVSRYLQAQPQAKKRRRWPLVLAAVAVVVAVAALFSRLDRVDQQYDSLQYAISNITTAVNRDIASITSRVEQVLKSQNELTADYGAEILGADLAANTVTFRVWAVPKTYVQGMEASFTAHNGVLAVSAMGAEGEGRQFSAELTCDLTDHIQLSVCFLTDRQEDTQLLDEYEGLYTGSFPVADLTWPLWFDVGAGDVLERGSNTVNFIEWGKDFGQGQQAVPETVRVGLFKDRELVLWYTPGTENVYVESDNGTELTQEECYQRGEITLERGSVYVEAIVITDQFGRTRVYPDTPIAYDESSGDWNQINGYAMGDEAAGWSF